VTAGCPRPRDCAGTSTDDSRIIVRPSGTEPKLKVYLEVIEPVTGDDLRGARERAASRLAALRAAYEGFTSI
jgi:phosphomannomutase